MAKGYAAFAVLFILIAIMVAGDLPKNAGNANAQPGQVAANNATEAASTEQIDDEAPTDPDADNPAEGFDFAAPTLDPSATLLSDANPPAQGETPPPADAFVPGVPAPVRPDRLGTPRGVLADSIERDGM